MIKISKKVVFFTGCLVGGVVALLCVGTVKKEIDYPSAADDDDDDRIKQLTQENDALRLQLIQLQDDTKKYSPPLHQISETKQDNDNFLLELEAFGDFLDEFETFGKKKPVEGGRRCSRKQRKK